MMYATQLNTVRSTFRTGTLAHPRAEYN